MAIVSCSPAYIENGFEIYYSELFNLQKQMQEHDGGNKEQKSEMEAEILKSRVRKRGTRQMSNKSVVKKRRLSKDSSSSSYSTNSSASDSFSESDSDYDYSIPTTKTTSTTTTTTTTTANTSLIVKDTISFGSPIKTPVLVPVDPHVWTAENIANWLKWITQQFKIVPEPDVKRFPNTGTELCKMSRADFWVCAGSHTGGCLLAKHFALTLHSATGRETSPMLNDNEPSEWLKFDACKGMNILS